MGGGASRQRPGLGEDVCSGPPPLPELGRSSTLGALECNQPTAFAVSAGLHRQASYETEREAHHKVRKRDTLASAALLWERAGVPGRAPDSPLGRGEKVGHEATLASGLTRSIDGLLPFLDDESQGRLETWASRAHNDADGPTSTFCERTITQAMLAARRSETMEAAVRNSDAKGVGGSSREDQAPFGDAGQIEACELVRQLSPTLQAIKAQEPLRPCEHIELPRCFAECGGGDAQTATYALGSAVRQTIRSKPRQAVQVLRGRSRESITKSPGQVDGVDFHMEDCEACSILVRDHAAQVVLHRCRDCKVFFGAVEGSMFLRDCAACVVRAACGQFRAEDCALCDVLLWTPARPVIDKSATLRFGPFGGLPTSAAYGEHWSHLQRAGLSDIDGDSWTGVVDLSPAWCPESAHAAIMREREAEDVLHSFPEGNERDENAGEEFSEAAAADDGATNTVGGLSACGLIVGAVALPAPTRRGRLEPLAEAPPIAEGKKEKEVKKGGRRRSRAAAGAAGICRYLMKQLQLHPDSNVDQKSVLTSGTAAEVVRPHLAKIGGKLGGQLEPSFLALVAETFVERVAMGRASAQLASPLVRALRPVTHSSVAALVARSEMQTQSPLEKGRQSSVPAMKEERLESLLRADVTRLQQSIDAKVHNVVLELLEIEVSWDVVEDQSSGTPGAAGLLQCLKAANTADMTLASLLPRITPGRMAGRTLDRELADRVFREARSRVLDDVARLQLTAEDVRLLMQEVRACPKHVGTRSVSSSSARHNTDDAVAAFRDAVGGDDDADPTSLQQKLLETFRKADVNGDGGLSAKELNKVMKRLGLHLTTKEVAILMADADVNHDGMIDFEEFVKWLCDDERHPEELTAEAGLSNGGTDIGYDGFAAARTRLLRHPGGRRFASHMSAITFLSLDRSVDSRVDTESLLTYIIRRANLHACYVELSMYDSCGDGYLREFDIERFVANFASNTPALRDHMDKSFLPFYIVHATRRLFFLLDERRAGRLAIKALVCSPVLSELQELRNTAPADFGRPSANWFALNSALSLYSQFWRLDADGDGMLSCTELAAAGSGMLSKEFLGQLLHEVPTFGGMLDFKGFLDFWLAYENWSTPQAMRYFWRAFGVGARGVVRAASLQPLAAEILRMMGEAYLGLDAMVVLQELWDMVGCQRRNRSSDLVLELRDLLESPLGGTFLLVLVDAMAFWRYDNRESLAHKANHEPE